MVSFETKSAAAARVPIMVIPVSDFLACGYFGRLAYCYIRKFLA
jgi:hypothetical protein